MPKRSPPTHTWTFPTVSVNGVGLIEQGKAYDLTRMPEGLREHPAWVEAEKEQE